MINRIPFSLFGFLLFFSFCARAQQPQVSSISPASGAAGSSILIAGNNFDLVASNNTVFFGSTKAQVTAASATQLSVTVPAGAIHQPVSVLTSNGIAYSPVSFLPTFPGGMPVFTNRSYSTAVDAMTGSSPVAVLHCDIDGDGKADLVATNNASSSFSVCRNTGTNGTLSFATKIDITSRTAPYGIAAGDLNGDGKADIVVSHQSVSPSISVFINTSTPGVISFATRMDLTTGVSTMGVDINDIDGDGRADIAYTNLGSNNFSVFRNTTTAGGVSFATKVDFTTAAGPYYILIRDLNADGKPDAAVSCQTGNAVSTLQNNSSPGTISFATKVDFTTGVSSLPRGLACGDIDGDGKADLATCNFANSTISVFRNTSSAGGISFAAKMDFFLAPQSQPEQISVGDLNGDGKADIAVPDKYGPSTHVNIFKNISVSGTISLLPRVSYATSLNSMPDYAAIGDLDGDGRAELSVACNGSGKISVFRNISAPQISSFTPASGNAGSSVIISGNNFRVNPSENVVFFGGARATVTAASNTSLTVTVPEGTTHLPISVTTDGLTGFSKMPFVLTFPGGDPIIANSFAARKTFFSGNNGPSATMADFDGDGKNDVAVPTYNNSTLSIFRNTSALANITFAAASTVTNFNAGNAIIVPGDLNGDGKPELISANGSNNTVSVYQNTSTPGAILFNTTGISNYVSGEATNAFVADLDGDGRPEVIADTKGYIAILPNTSTTSTLSFGTAQLIATVNYLDRTIVADFDSDGKPDMITGQSYLRNTSANGVISFGPMTNFAPLSTNNYYASADFNGDGKLDLAELNTEQARVRFYNNTSSPGSISFTLEAQSYGAGPFPKTISAADLNGDGRPDISVANVEYDAISVLANNSSGAMISFSSKVDYAAGHWPWASAIGDLDGDGKPDMVVPNLQNQYFSVFRFNIDTPPPGIPQVDSFTPLQGPVGTIITISGNNFNSNTSDNIVLFNGVRAEVTSASSNSLSVKVPIGARHEVFSVTNTGLTGYSKKPFKVTFTGGGQAFTANSFDSPKLFPSSDGSWGLSMGDLDGDGKLDAALANLNSNTTSVFRNTSIPGEVMFAPKMDLPATNGPKTTTMADLNGDGKPELLVGNSGDNILQIYRNTSSPGTISFAVPVLYPVDSLNFGHPVAIAIHDLDSDGKPDIAVVNANSYYLTLIRNTTTTPGGALSFGTKVHFDATSSPNSLSIKDMDGNGKPDIVVGTGTTTVHVFSNTSTVGNISFTRGLNFPSGETYGVSGIYTMDLNEDEKPDIFMSLADNGMSRRINQSTRGTHVFAGVVNHGPMLFTKGITMDDFDGDGRTDLAVMSLFSRSAAVYKNNFNPSDTIYFKPPVEYSVTPDFNSPTAIISGDFDGDGKVDIASSLLTNNFLSVIRNKTGDPFRLCPNGGITLTPSTSGAGYQWQLSTDNGANFANISDNIYYTGTNSLSLQLSNIPSSWTGYQYRCSMAAGTSEVFTLRFFNTWTGAVNSDWENPANWSCGAPPDSFTDVVIGAGATVVLNSNTSIATLSLSPGASLTVAPGFTLTLLGH